MKPVQTEKIHVDRMMDIFLKKEKAFIKEKTFVVRMLVAEIYNILEKKLVLKPAQYFYLPSYDRPVTSIARDGIAIRGYNKANFDVLKMLDTDLLLRIHNSIKAENQIREEARKKREIDNKTKREKAKKLQKKFNKIKK